MHSTIPNSKEHLTVLSCVNAASHHVPNLYIFKGKRRHRNFILKCEPQVVMAMQPNAWMTAFLFSTWISHFISILSDRYGISQENRHLLLLDRHGSHVTLEVVQKAKSRGLDIITLPSHTSHRLQPLDVSIFKPFKVAFRTCRDRWSIENKGRGARKEELAEWVGTALKKVLTPIKITKGFEATGIWPLQSNAMDKYMAPSTCYIDPCEDEDGDDVEEEVVVSSNAGAEDLIPETQESPQQYFIQSESDCDDSSGNSRTESEEGPRTMVQRNLFPLPRVECRA